MKKTREIICFTLVMVMAICIFPVCPVDAQTNKLDVEMTDFYFEPSENFYLANPNDVILILEGQPIYKKDLDYNFNLNNSARNRVVNKIEFDYMLQAQTSGLKTEKRLIPKKYNNAIVKYSISAPRYSGTNIAYYLTEDNGAAFASGLETGSAYGCAAILAGFVPHVGPAVSVIMSFASMYKSDVASRIRERTNKHKKVHINEASSNYGGGYGVFDWNSRYIEVPLTSRDKYSSQTLENLQYK